MDKKQESFEWSVYSTVTGLGTAATAAIGAAIAEFVCFTFTFLLVGILSLIGCLILFNLEKRKEKLQLPKLYDYHEQRKMTSQKYR